MRIINKLAISVCLDPHAKLAYTTIFQQFTFNLEEQKVKVKKIKRQKPFVGCLRQRWWL